MSWFDNIRFPYFNSQQLNLDWILNEVKSALNLLPKDDGQVGQVLKKTQDGTEWEDIGALAVDIHDLPKDTEIATTDEMIFYDKSAGANRKIEYSDMIANAASSGTPRMDGTASAGTSKLYSRYDHVHPTDTSRAPATWFTDNALQIAHGGTGSTTRRGAMENLHGYDLGEVNELTAGANLNTITAVGMYNIATGAVAAAITGAPTTNTGCKIAVMRIGAENRIAQIAVTSEVNPKIYRRWYNGTAYQEWTRDLTTADFRFEHDSLVYGSTLTISAVANSRGVIFTTGSGDTVKAAAIINVDTTGFATVTPILTAVNITFDTSTSYAIKVTNSGTGTQRTAFVFGFFYVETV